MKILFQKLWKLHLNWDDEVPLDVQECHQTWRNQMNEFIDFLFPRCYYRQGGNIIHKELHGFADALEQAYAAVVYLRMTYSNRAPSVTLVSAKTKGRRPHEETIYSLSRAVCSFLHSWQNFSLQLEQL